VELRNNFETADKDFIIKHWITSSKYDILDELLLKNFTTSSQGPTPISLGIIRFWTEICSI